MEKIIFEEDVIIYKTKTESDVLLKNVLNDVDIFLKSAPYSPKDNYTYMDDWSSFDFQTEMKPNNFIEEIIKFGMEVCFKLRCEDESPFNRINVNSWVNVVKKGKPKQENFRKDDIVTLHNHIDLQKSIESFYPTYTFVYYVQMPDNLKDNEGTLIVEGSDNQRYYYLPQEGDLLVMKGYLPHSPNKSPNSTKNRVVIAANVGFENAKKINSLI
jgi:hypothetical protein